MSVRRQDRLHIDIQYGSGHRQQSPRVQRARSQYCREQGVRHGEQMLDLKYKLPPEELERRYKVLVQRMHMNDKYRSYRIKQMENPTPVWGDDIEELFLRACVRFEPCYRQTVWCPEYAPPENRDKKLGRNEVIAGMLMKELKISKEEFVRKDEQSRGAGRCASKKNPRKVISSHLQVLCKMFSEGYRDQWVLDQLKKSTRDGSEAKLSRRNGRASRYEPYGYGLTQRARNGAFQLPAANKTLKSQAALPSGPTWQPLRFSMYIAKAAAALGPEPEPIHTITDMHTSVETRDLRGGASWQTEFPHLTRLWSDGLIERECAVYVADCPIHVAGMEVSHHGLFNDYAFSWKPTATAATRSSWHSSIVYFDSEGQLQTPAFREYVQPECDGDGEWSVRLSIDCDWWVRQYAIWAREASGEQNDRAGTAVGAAAVAGCSRAVADSRRCPRRQIKNLSAVQIITPDSQDASAPHGLQGEAKPVLVVCWRFFEHPTKLTRWTRLTLPPAQATSTATLSDYLAQAAQASFDTSTSDSSAATADDAQLGLPSSVGLGLDAAWSCGKAPNFQAAQSPTFAYMNMYNLGYASGWVTQAADSVSAEDASQATSWSSPEKPTEILPMQDLGRDGAHGSWAFTGENRQYDAEVMRQMSAITKIGQDEKQMAWSQGRGGSGGRGESRAGSSSASARMPPHGPAFPYTSLTVKMGGEGGSGAFDGSDGLLEHPHPMVPEGYQHQHQPWGAPLLFPPGVQLGIDAASSSSRYGTDGAQQHHHHLFDLHHTQHQVSVGVSEQDGGGYAEEWIYAPAPRHGQPAILLSQHEVGGEWQSDDAKDHHHRQRAYFPQLMPAFFSPVAPAAHILPSSRTAHGRVAPAEDPVATATAAGFICGGGDDDNDDDDDDGRPGEQLLDSFESRCIVASNGGGCC